MMTKEFREYLDRMYDEYVKKYGIFPVLDLISALEEQASEEKSKN